MELPLWLPGAEYAGMTNVPADRAIAAGLTTRPLPDTIRDTLAWVRNGDAPADPPAGLARDKEQQLLAAWAARS